MTVGINVLGRNAMLDALTTFAGAGALLRIYDGTKPASSGGALSGNNKLAELPFSGNIGAASSSGVLTLTPPTAANALLSGTATWFRIVKSDGTTYVFDGTVAQGSGGDINLNSTAISSGASVSMTSGSITAGNP